MNYTTYWIDAKGADMKSLLEQHQKCFPGNQLSVVDGLVKVAILDGEEVPKDATVIAPVIEKLAFTGNVSL